MVTKELLLQEELKLRGIFYKFLPCIYLALDMHPPIIPLPPPSAQGPPPPLPLHSIHLLLRRLAREILLNHQRVQVPLVRFTWSWMCRVP